MALDEFLAPQELAELMRFTLEHEADFQASEVVSPSSERGVVNYDHRRSRVLMDLGPHQDLLLETHQDSSRGCASEARHVRFRHSWGRDANHGEQ